MCFCAWSSIGSSCILWRVALVLVRLFGGRLLRITELLAELPHLGTIIIILMMSCFIRCLGNYRGVSAQRECAIVIIPCNRLHFHHRTRFQLLLFLFVHYFLPCLFSLQIILLFFSVSLLGALALFPCLSSYRDLYLC